MSQAPSMPVYTDALLGDTLHLSTEEFGAYCLLLFATWRNNGEALKDSDRDLARICRVSLPRWRRSLRPKLVHFFSTDDGSWHQKRLEKEWQFVQKKSATLRENGILGGRAKALKSKETALAKAIPNGLAPRPSPREVLSLLNNNNTLGCAYAPAREEPAEPPSAEDKAHVDRLVGEVLDVLALPASGLRNGIHNADAYRETIAATKRDQWLNNLSEFVGEAYDGLPERMAAWEAIEQARAAGSRAATPPDVRRALDKLSQLRETHVAHAEAAE